MTFNYVEKLNIDKIQTFQNLTVRKTNCPPFIFNHTLHTDLKLKTVYEEAKIFYKIFYNRLSLNSYPLLEKNLSFHDVPGNPPRRLQMVP